MGALLAQSNRKSIGYLSGVLDELSSCAANFQQMKDAIGKYLTQSDRQYLILFAESDIKPTSESMARFWVGGKDCTHKNVSPGDQRFLNKLPDLIEQRAVEKQQEEQQTNNQNGSDSGSGSEDPYASDPTGGSGSSGSDSGSSGSGSDSDNGSQPDPEPDNGGSGGSQPHQTDWTKYALIGGGVVGSLVLISALSG